MLDNFLKIFNIKLLLGIFFSVVFKKKHQLFNEVTYEIFI